MSKKGPWVKQGGGDRMFRLPSGGVTADENNYCKAWDRLFKPICKATGAVPHAFDPSMQFRFGDGNRGFGSVVTMPVEFVLALNKALKQ